MKLTDTQRFCSERSPAPARTGPRLSEETTNDGRSLLDRTNRSIPGNPIAEDQVAV
ncbi:hypothetical protein Pd630_LPD10105 (plasmid) [Rhodococcus opacus PD630]|nr:hypothetical protein Pd630_LPD10105 [Rhodococcus opacus PD630]